MLKALVLVIRAFLPVPHRITQSKSGIFGRDNVSGHFQVGLGLAAKVSFSKECLVASGSYDNTIKLWNLTTGECIRMLSGHGRYVDSVSFSDEGLLASESGDRTIKPSNRF